MEFVAVLAAGAVIIAITCLPLLLFRSGLFASDDTVEAQIGADRREALRASKGDQESYAARLSDAREVRAHRRLRNFAFTLVILPGLLVGGMLVFAVLAGWLAFASAPRP